MNNNTDQKKKSDTLKDLNIDFYHITLIKLTDNFKCCIQNVYETDTQ